MTNLKIISVEPCEPPCPPMPNANEMMHAHTASASSSGASTSASPPSAPPPCHHPPYDLRRKSPPHHDSNTPSTSSPPTAYAHAYTVLPARKRPRRSCSASNESKFYISV